MGLAKYTFTANGSVRKRGRLRKKVRGKSQKVIEAMTGEQATEYIDRVGEDELEALIDHLMVARGIASQDDLESPEDESALKDLLDVVNELEHKTPDEVADLMHAIDGVISVKGLVPLLAACRYSADEVMSAAKLVGQDTADRASALR